MVDARGRAASFTGSGCHAWAGGIVGDGYAAQGNILVPGTVEAMAERYEAVRGGEGELADWLVEALAAGQEAGGDSRGRQAAAVLVVRAGGGYGGNNDRYLDLRVDDDPYPDPAAEGTGRHAPSLFWRGRLRRMRFCWQTWPPICSRSWSRPATIQVPSPASSMRPTRSALRELVGQENLEERWNGEGIVIDRLVVDYLMEKFG